MRIGVIAEGLRDWITLRSQRFPRPMFDVMGAMLLSRAVMAGVHFRVFDRLRHGPKSAAELAAEARCDAQGMELLLNALAACRYLEQRDNRYRNTRLARRWLLSDSDQTAANFIRYNYDQWEWVNHLEEYIESGKAREIHENLGGPQAWRNYMLGMRDLARLTAEEVVARIGFASPPRRLLDIGAAHCHYSIVMCRAHPGLHVTVVELEPAAQIGREEVAAAGLTDRFTFRPGNLRDTPFGENYDAVFLFSVMHHLDEAANRATLKRIHAALRPGGRLAVLETFRQEHQQKRPDQFGSLLALFFGLTSRQRTYSFEQVAEWTRAAGFGKIARVNLRTAPLAALLVADKQTGRTGNPNSREVV